MLVGIKFVKNKITDCDESGRSCIIKTNSIEPIIKSRIIDFFVGCLFSSEYVLNAPREAISDPPKIIPIKRSFIFWEVGGKNEI